MNKLMMVIVAFLSLGLIAADADAARRLGGGSNFGSQRSITPPAPKSPAQQAQAAPATKPAQQAGNKWLGPLAGLALGAGLAALFFNNGLAGALGGILTVVLLVAAALFAIRLLRSKLQPSSGPLQFAGAGTPRAGSDLSTHFGGAAPAAMAKRYPPGFDAEQFARHAKINFTQLQAANDARDLSAMRDFMTPGLYSEIAAQISAADPGAQKTEAVTLDADVLEVVSERDVHVASVRFSGTIRERADALPEAFSEVWHLEKPVNGSTGWLISGIQQD